MDYAAEAVVANPGAGTDALTASDNAPTGERQ